MRKLLLPLLVLFITAPQISRASHSAGAELSYEYIGDSTGISYHYAINLVLYRYTEGINLASSFPITINSSCWSIPDLTVHQYVPKGASVDADGGVILNTFSECIDSTSVTGTITAYYYRAFLVLPGTCHDYTFSWSQCCRNSIIDNLATYPAMYVEAKLNNTLGPNSSPHITTPAAKAFCVGTKFTWSHEATEKDGDSLSYKLTQPLSAVNNPIPWATGYSTTEPISTNSGVVFSSHNGKLEFTPSQQEVDAIKIQVEEYRFDTIVGQWLLVGITERDMQIFIASNCTSTNNNVQMTRPSLGGPPLSMIDCYATHIRLKTSKRVECSSISPDGTDFGLHNSQGGTIPIIAAGTDSCEQEFTNSIWVQVHDSITYNDTLTLVSRKGNDMNTLLNACGYSMEEGDSLQYFVWACPTSIGLKEHTAPGINLYPNPASDVLKVEIPLASGGGEIRILDIQGQVLAKKNGVYRQSEIPVGHLPTGMYLLQYTEQKHRETLKFQKL